MKPRSDLQISDIECWIDTREQTPLNLAPLRSRVMKLDCGDYTIAGLQHLISVERKSLQDLIQCVGRERERFEREIQRLRAYETSAIVVEGSLDEIEKKSYRGEMSPQAVLGSVLGWIASGVPILFVGSHEAAGRYVGRLLFIAARRRWRELQSFHSNLKISGG